MYHSCVSTLPPDQEEALAWQRQSGPGAERDSWSCFGMVRNGTGSGACPSRDSSEREQREVLGLVRIDIAVPGTCIQWEKSHLR